LVLYCFLGVFIIFIVDSFARAGKYVRWSALISVDQLQRFILYFIFYQFKV
jgi:hypothetical protein